MKTVYWASGKEIKYYECDKCKAEVYSLICRFINGEWLDICVKCYEKEVQE